MIWKRLIRCSKQVVTCRLMPKPTSQIKKIVRQYKEILQRLGIHTERIILYGSFARGNARKDSDIDLVVISEDFRKLNLRQRLEILGVAAARIMKPIEAQGYTPAEVKKVSRFSLLNEILKVGIFI